MKGTSSAQIRKALKEVENQLEPKRENLIPALQVVQEKLGWLPREAMLGISRYLKIPESEVWGTASFYAQFRFSPVGKNMIVVCRGTACHVRGSAGILRELERELEIKPGETTEDLMFSLERVACLGSCALAPVMVVNGKVYGNMNTVKVKHLIEELRKQETKKSGKSKKTRRVK